MDYRIYFNRKNEKPQIWSFDEGAQTSETNVCHWMLHGISAGDGGDLSVEPNHDSPTVWVEVLHSKPVQVINGTAHFWHDDDWRVRKFNLAQQTPEQKEDAAEADVQRRLSELP